MSARLIVRNATGPSRSIFLDDENPHEVGRDPACAVQLRDASISRHHARLHIDGNRWRVEDLGSKNGTFVGGESVSSGVELGPESLLRFGDVYCSIVPANRLSESQTDRRLDRTLRWQQRLSPSLGSRLLVTESLQAILELSGFHRGFALLQDAAGQWRVFARSGIDDGEMDSEGFSGSLGSVRECVRTGEPVVGHQLDPATWLGGRPSVIEGGIQALLCLPLTVGERTIGVIYADSREPGESISELDLNILKSLASHAALALAVTRMEAAVQSLAGELDRDALWSTGVDVAEDDRLLLT